ncbi:MAG TPA: hypothetical protein VNQ90_20920 [Chthoniobacteraceae bacterium]|nr:hypothetical protein [Chthoniobacteraceae bacterium]
MKPDTFVRSVFGRRLAFVAAVAALIAATPSPGVAQAPRAASSSPELEALVREVALQFQEIERNQTEIDQRLAKIEEAVRQARLFAARAGRKGGGE